MHTTFLGLPWAIWGLLCLAVAAVYMIVWPGWRAGSAVRPRPAWRYVVLRWFHALVWILLAWSCFTRANYLPGGAAVANGVALLALPLYLIYVAALLAERKAHR